MPSDRSLNLLDRFQREYQRATDDENPMLYLAAALPIERLRRTAPPESAYWMALAERLHRKGERVEWMVACAGGFHRRIVLDHYNEAFDDADITDLQIMAKKQHFENGEVRDGVDGDSNDDAECPNGCGPNEACSECPDSKFKNTSA